IAIEATKFSYTFLLVHFYRWCLRVVHQTLARTPGLQTWNRIALLEPDGSRLGLVLAGRSCTIIVGIRSEVAIDSDNLQQLACMAAETIGYGMIDCLKVRLNGLWIKLNQSLGWPKYSVLSFGSCLDHYLGGLRRLQGIGSGFQRSDGTAVMVPLIDTAGLRALMHDLLSKDDPLPFVNRQLWIILGFKKTTRFPECTCQLLSNLRRILRPAQLGLFRSELAVLD